MESQENKFEKSAWCMPRHCPWCTSWLLPCRCSCSKDLFGQRSLTLFLLDEKPALLSKQGSRHCRLHVHAQQTHVLLHGVHARLQGYHTIYVPSRYELPRTSFPKPKHVSVCEAPLYYKQQKCMVSTHGISKKKYHVWIPSICHPAFTIILHAAPNAPNAPKQSPIAALITLPSSS